MTDRSAIATLGPRPGSRSCCVLWLLLALGSPLTAAAFEPIPGTPYFARRQAHAYAPLTSGTVLLGPSAATSREAELELPFVFRFYDRSFDRLTASTNGVIAFGSVASLSSANPVPGDPGGIDGWIAPFWDFLRLSVPGAAIRHRTLGQAPRRVLELEASGLDRCCGSGPGLSFQLRLHEGTSGRIQLRYGPAGVASTPLDGTMGMEDPDGTRPVRFDGLPPACGNDCSSIDLAANAGAELELRLDPGIDLAAARVSAPVIGFAGTSLRVRFAVENLHSALLEASQLAIVLTPVGAAAPASIHRFAGVTLPGFAVHEAELDVPLPRDLPEGAYTVELWVDSEERLAELDEANNLVAAPESVRILAAGPDLAVRSVVSHRAAAPVGGAFEVTAEILNAGSSPVRDIPVAIVLSGNPVVTAGDLELTRFSLSSAPGESVTTTLSVPIAAEVLAGSYFVGVVADPDHALPELSESNNSRAAVGTLLVTGGIFAITTTRLPQATVNASYLARLEAAGSAAPVRWSITSGALPEGLFLVPETGEVSGRARRAEVATFTVEARSGGGSAEATLSLISAEANAPLTVVTRGLPAALRDRSYSAVLLAAGGTSGATLAWSASGLPEGLLVTPEGLLEGRPAMIGVYALELEVADGSAIARRGVTLHVVDSARVLIDPVPLPSATLGARYEAALQATGGHLPLSWTVVAGRLPPGITLDPSGVFTGAPEEAGSFPLVISARDAGMGADRASDTNTFELSVADDGAMTIAPGTLPAARPGAAYEVELRAPGGRPPLTWAVTHGRLPEGLEARPAADRGALLLRGTPQAPDSAALLVEVSDAQGRRARKALLLRVEAPEAPAPAPEGGCDCATHAGEGTGLWPLLLLAALGWAGRRRARR